MKRELHIIIVLVIIVGLGLVFQHKFLGEFPSRIHAWAQSDRYAISLGFLDNDFNFLEPQTFIYNHQFPHSWEVPTESTITAVDFPVHDYIVAILMKVFGSTSPLFFRLYVLLYSFIGLYFLFKLSCLLTGDYLKSIFVLLFAATSPVFLYYQAGFLPTIPSLSNTIIGIFFYCKWVKGFNVRYFWLSILFLTLATLARTTFAIPLVAVLIVEFFRYILKEVKIGNRLISIIFSVIAILSYYFYNVHLRETYGSVFLYYLLPPTSVEHALEIINKVFESRIYQYFSRYHYITLCLSLTLFIYYLVINNHKINKSKLLLGSLIFIYLTGCLIFACLMLQQFTYHDYYFLDTFYLPLVMLFIFTLSAIPPVRKIKSKIIFTSILVLSSILFILDGNESYKKRRSTDFWDKSEATVRNFKNSSTFLDSIGVKQEAKMLVIDAVAPNIPFILMNRKGYAVMDTEQNVINKALKWDYDYIVVQNEYFMSDVYPKFNDVLTRLEKIASNGSITVCSLTENKQQSIKDFMGFAEISPIYEKWVSFENTPDSLWKKVNITDTYAYNGKFSGYLSSDDAYGLTFKTSNLDALRSASRTLFFSSYFRKDSKIRCALVVSITSNDQSIYYKTNYLNEIISKDHEWQKVSLMFQLPKVKSEDYDFSVFLWNIGESELYFDNFKLSVY